MNKKWIVVLIFPLLLGIRACSWNPSDFFTSLDKDRDDRLSYVEWITHYSSPVHNHDIAQCSRKDFYVADCDQDDYLTWEEYYRFRFKRQTCGTAAVKTMRQLYESSPELQINPTRKSIEGLVSSQVQLLKDRERELKQKFQMQLK